MLDKLKKPNYTVLYFGAPWCGNCTLFKPIVKKTLDKFYGKVYFEEKDVDDNKLLVDQYEIMSIPCLILLKDENKVSELFGVKLESEITNWINSNIK